MKITHADREFQALTPGHRSRDDAVRHLAKVQPLLEWPISEGNIGCTGAAWVGVARRRISQHLPKWQAAHWSPLATLTRPATRVTMPSEQGFQTPARRLGPQLSGRADESLGARFQSLKNTQDGPFLGETNPSGCSRFRGL